MDKGIMMRRESKPSGINLKIAGTSAIALLSALATTSPAVAQLETSEIIDFEDGSSEVIVTVERRAQSLQDYAGTAAVITGEELSLLGIDNFNQLDGKIPGLSVANNGGNIEVFIRGVGSTNNTELGDPAAATHLNDVYVPRPAGFGAAFFDIERVEVNIGPQGTLRGRNATAGSVNAIPWKPGLGITEAHAQIGVGNFGEFSAEAVVNWALGEKAALRVAGYHLSHDSYYENITPCSDELGLDIPTCEEEGIGVAEAVDDIGLRAALLVKPVDNLSVTLTADYLENSGTGYTGTNFAAPLGNGVLPEDIDDPREVFGRAFTPIEDVEHYGLKAHVLYEANGWNAEYIGSIRDLSNNRDFATPASPNFEGALDFLTPDTFDNFSRVNIQADSESQVHEFRLFSDDDSRLQWTTGAFFFKEDQRTFLGTTGDRNPFFTGVEFNQTTDTDSFSFYGDATYDVTDQFRVTGGLRYTDDHKDRFGVNARFGQAFIIGGDGFGCCFATGVGTEGFEFAAFDRTIFNPDTDESGDVSPQEVIDFYFDGIRTFGARDGLDDIFANGEVVDPIPFGDRPLCAFPLIGFDGTSNGSCFSQATADLFNGEGPDVFGPLVGRTSFAVVVPQNAPITLQAGSLDNDFIDWRIRSEYDFTEDNLVYGLISRGTKSGGFNDTVPDSASLFVGAAPEITGGVPAEFITGDIAPTYDPETNTLFEIGSKNEFDVGGLPAKFNVSAFYNDYDDYQATTLLSTAQIIDTQGVELTPEQLMGLGGNIVSFTFNASDAEIYGAQFEGGLQLPGDINLDGTLLWLAEARFVNSQDVQDSRFQADVDPDNAVDRNIEGNRLIRTPEWQFNGSVSKALDVKTGTLDGIVSFGYRSSQHMTIFNGIDFNNPDNPDLRLNDLVRGYWTVDAGMGYSHGDDGKWRIEGYVSNLTNEVREQAIIITQFDNTRFFSTPRTYGLRLRAKFQ